MRLAHLAPDDTELGVGGTAGEIFGRLALVNICDALSKIEVDILAIIKALDLHQCRVIVLVLQPPFESEDHTLGVQTHRLSLRHDDGA